MVARGPRVLFVQGAAVRAGAEMALLGRLRHLAASGVEGEVAFLADGPFRAEVERMGIPTTLLDGVPRAREVRRLPGAVRAVASLAREREIDVIEACGEKMSLICGWAARRAGCGSIYNLQDPPRRSVEATAVQVGAVTGRHNTIVVPSRWMAAAFRRRLGVRASVMPNTISFEDLPERGADVRELAGWPRDSVVVGLFGRLVAWKGGEVLLRALHRLARDRPDVRCLVVGGTLYGWEPDHPARLRDLTRRLGLTDRVHFTGHREDSLDLMMGCDAVCHCSLTPEPFGMVVLEAMALGKPVIATLTGGPEEMIEHRRTGILVGPGDERALADEISALAESADERESLGRAGRAAARRDFDSLALAEDLGRLYRRASLPAMG